MQKWFLFCALLFVSGLFVSESCASVCPGPGQFEVSGEFIYFKPQIDRPFFVQRLEEVAQNSLRVDLPVNNIGFCPGFRVELGYGLCACNGMVNLRYTYLDGSHTKSVDGLLLIPQIDIIGPGKAKNKLGIKYHAVDLLYSHLVCCHSQVNCALNGGVHFSCFNVDNCTVIDFTSPPEFTISETVCGNYGIGPKIGVQGEYRFVCLPCVTLQASAHGALLATYHDAEVTANPPFGILGGGLKVDEMWRVVPFCEIRAGLNYQFCLCSFGCSLEIGYEFMSYLRTISDLDIVNDRVLSLIIAPVTKTDYSDISFQGPYLNLAVRF